MTLHTNKRIAALIVLPFVGRLFQTGCWTMSYLHPNYRNYLQFPSALICIACFGVSMVVALRSTWHGHIKTAVVIGIGLVVAFFMPGLQLDPDYWRYVKDRDIMVAEVSKLPTNGRRWKIFELGETAEGFAGASFRWIIFDEIDRLPTDARQRILENASGAPDRYKALLSLECHPLKVRKVDVHFYVVTQSC